MVLRSATSCCTSQNHYVPRHKNNRYINRYYGKPYRDRIQKYVHARADSNTFTMGMGNPMPESTLTLF